MADTWYFTFGFGQTLKAHRAHSDQADGAGIPLDNCYVRIEGTAESSRAVMVDLFGATWCDQYSEYPGIDGQPMCDLTALVGLASITREYQRRMPGTAPVHYLNRTEAECIAAGQTTICEACKAAQSLGFRVSRTGTSRS